MAQALTAARQAGEQGEVPIGAALYLDQQQIALAGNTCNREHNPLQHAEMRVLHQAHPLLQQADFRRATLFVTLEPCPMCLGAILHSHLGQLVFGAYNLKWGSCGTVSDFQSLYPSESLRIWGGICERECAKLLEDFFGGLRANG